ncbi:MAG TPA: hypothetical protein VLG39_00630 [Nitrospirota bacterium]|nr:hypothetical protein [Nitrospirota bacterium]
MKKAIWGQMAEGAVREILPLEDEKGAQQSAMKEGSKSPAHMNLALF